ncbi:MAG: hypothetical protein LBH97_00610 [Treponema sp.]|jgi:hypothetical protein|nr:hypothetical protein [Treponema sp.]
MFIKGFTYGFDGKSGDYRTPDAAASIKKLKQAGNEWICIAFIAYQEKFSSTKIHFDYRYTVKDRDIEFAVRKAHELGMKVCLKPVVNCKDGVWRAEINFPDSDMMGKDVYWDEWFEHYTAFMCHYAEMAEYTNCEMLCIGCEMVATEKKELHWRKLIKEVRKLYTGPLVYNANHGTEDNVKWFDAVDYIGTSAYYPVAKKPGETEENMYQAWQPIKERVKALSEKWSKKVIFIEIGCRSAKGCAMMPWDFSHRKFPFDEDEQAHFYSSCLRTFFDEPWFAGFFWWEWSTRIYDIDKAKNNRSFNVYGKKAEKVLKKWYSKPRD